MNLEYKAFKKRLVYIILFQKNFGPASGGGKPMRQVTISYIGKLF
jgi:hypothetical protein